jgi:hypothetical protein
MCAIGLGKRAVELKIKTKQAYKAVLPESQFASRELDYNASTGWI